ncbi:MAG: sigma-70 family RNA polymerase sigma factor [Planctomycetota bacterium]
MQRDEAEDHWENDAGTPREPAGEAEGCSDDPELVQRLRDGDGDALRLLMQRYDRLVRYAVFRLCRAECVQDPTFLDSRASETWTGFVRSVQRGHSRTLQNLKTYLIQIAKNKCADAQRRPETALGGERAGVGADLDGIEAPSATSVELLIQAEEVLALRDCMAKLSSGDKRICEQMDHIVAGRWILAAQALGMPESTLRSRWSVIAAKLRICLEKKVPKSFAPPPEEGDS